MKAEDLKGMNGRRVLIEGLIVAGELPEFGRYAAIRFADEAYSRVIPYAAIREILPQELRVGDKVRGCGGEAATLLCIHGDEAWLGYAHGCGTYDLADVTLIEPAQ